MPAELIRQGLEKFGGVGRRFEVKGVHNGVTLIDDYGHHPAEIRATLEAARGCAFKRLLVIFQPHRYSRTQHLWDEFRQAFNQADILIVTDIYAAGEAPDREHQRRESSPWPSAPPATKTSSTPATCRRASSFCCAKRKPGDAVLAIGAGSVGRALDQLAVLIGRNCRSRSLMRISDKPVAARLAALGVELRPVSRLQELTSLGIGGTTDLLLIRRYDALPEVIRELKNDGIPYKFLGGGTNVLVADGELPWVMLHLPAAKPGVRIEGHCCVR